MPGLAAYSRPDATAEYLGHSFDAADLIRRTATPRAEIARSLDELARKLTAAAAAEEAEFHGLVQLAQRLLTLDDLEMSRLLKVSRPTIGRWVRGVSVPHPLARKAILDALAKKARAQAKALRK